MTRIVLGISVQYDAIMYGENINIAFTESQYDVMRISGNMIDAGLLLPREGNIPGDGCQFGGKGQFIFSHGKFRRIQRGNLVSDPPEYFFYTKINGMRVPVEIGQLLH